MTLAPTLCPQCLDNNVIATASGPTCTHRERTGAAWFPEWWLQPPVFEPSQRRNEWLELNAPRNT